MKVKMQVIGFGEASFTSSKNGRVYNRATLMGFAIDPYDGSQFPALATLAFDAPALPETPKGNAFYLIDVLEMSVKNAMTNFTFSTLVPFSEGSGKVK